MRTINDTMNLYIKRTMVNIARDFWTCSKRRNAENIKKFQIHCKNLMYNAHINVIDSHPEVRSFNYPDRNGTKTTDILWNFIAQNIKASLFNHN